MKKWFAVVIFIFSFSSFSFSQTDVDYQKISQQLLENIKNKKDYATQIKILASSTLEELVSQLQSDEQKIAFWVNIYNAFIQIQLTENPTLYQDKSAFFSAKKIEIADEKLSFDDIEHSILRKSRIKISLGYLRKWFRPKWERKLRVDKIDWRIHFALNCGAKSCPPIAIYDVENLNNQLDFMTKTYLKEQTTFDKESLSATSVSLFSWFRGDFGGLCGAKEILFNYKITPEKPKKITFSNYDWNLSLGNFRTIAN